MGSFFFFKWNSTFNFKTCTFSEQWYSAFYTLLISFFMLTCWFSPLFSPLFGCPNYPFHPVLSFHFLLYALPLTAFKLGKRTCIALFVVLGSVCYIPTVMGTSVLHIFFLPQERRGRKNSHHHITCNIRRKSVFCCCCCCVKKHALILTYPVASRKSFPSVGLSSKGNSCGPSKPWACCISSKVQKDATLWSVKK